MGLGCISHDCKLDLVAIQGNLHQRRFATSCTRPVYMDDNARPHRSREVTAYLQSEAVTSVPWPAMSADLNPIEHIWDMLGRRIQSPGTYCTKHSSVGSSIASGMAAAITTGHPTSNWKDEAQGRCRHPSTWGLHPVLNFEN
jgi:hypothetical protein